MDKNAIKKFAINARNELRTMVKQKASVIGISENGIEDKLSISTNEIEYYIDDKVPLIGKDIQKRKKLVEELNTRAKKSDYKTAFNDLVEEVAYTWFNRIVAIRFMEVNDYLPSKTRVLSSTQNRNEPDIMVDPLALEGDLGAFSDDDRQLISDAWETEDPMTMDKLYKMLFIKQANALNKNLPYLFEKTNDYAELLFTPSYNHGVIKDIVTEINEDDFNVKNGGQVEIIGWIYQYYNTKLKDKVLKKKKYKESDIPAVTQLFTPDWIVKYLVENSLGRYWINVLNAKGNKNNSKQIADEFGWNYFMPSAEQSEKVQIKINNDSKNLSGTNVQDITLIDVSMGSGHILVYAFEVFMQIYLSEGYSQRDAAKLILNNNLYGLDIDTRAFQLAYFSIMMQARRYNRRILKYDIKPNVFDIPEYNDLDYMQFADLVDEKTLKVIQLIIETFRNGNNYGSLIHFASDLDWDNLIKISNNEELGQLSFGTIESNQKIKELQEILNISKILSSKYTINITNPPYMGSGKMNPVLSKYVGKNYPNSKSDLFATFMERTKELTTNDGYYALITQHSWMFLSSFEKLRHELTKDTLINMAHLGTRAFEDIGGEVVQSTAFVFQNKQVNDYVGTYERLVDFNSQDKKEQAYLKAVENPQIKYVYRTNQANFSKIPGSPIAYWASENLFEDFVTGKRMDSIVKPKVGLQTADNNRFLRMWYEVIDNNISFNSKSIKESLESHKKWFPYNKGGAYRKWYGNYDYVVNWENDGYKIRNFTDSKGKVRSRPQNTNYYFHDVISHLIIS
ncbi:BREX-1 system adenine-specific DNA-methyltransferase PglX [Companilactobacillus farciminis]|uniref:BREX-1 system adenine-specific DNA-methyltransferase PglX n=1 Tax=Companilactobacillus farciminis TaxID=1612 RepID=UPI0019169588|nr:BREX-1 system adenine-specific DNA-methyltransferase PglX [Companilactobacillus farciminis]